MRLIVGNGFPGVIFRTYKEVLLEGLNHLRNAQMSLFNYHYYAVDLGRETVLPHTPFMTETRPSLLIYADGLALNGDRSWPENIKSTSNPRIMALESRNTWTIWLIERFQYRL